MLKCWFYAKKKNFTFGKRKGKMFVLVFTDSVQSTLTGCTYIALMKFV